MRSGRFVYCIYTVGTPTDRSIFLRTSLASTCPLLRTAAPSGRQGPPYKAEGEREPLTTLKCARCGLY